MMAKKFVTPARALPFSILSPLYFFRSFLTLRVLECGWIFRRSAIQDQGDFIPPFHAWVGPWLFWQDILCGIHRHIPEGPECHSNAGEWRCRSDLGGVRGDKTSGRTSKARNEAVAIYSRVRILVSRSTVFFSFKYPLCMTLQQCCI